MYFLCTLPSRFFLFLTISLKLRTFTKSVLCGHLIQKLRVKCSVMYFLCTLPHIFTGFLLYDSYIALLQRLRAEIVP